MNSLSKIIKSAEEAGISIKEIAEHLEVMPATIARYRDGTSKPLPNCINFYLKKIKELINDL